MLELEGHPEDRPFFMTNSSKSPQNSPGQQVLAHLESESLENALKLEDPKVAKRDAERNVHAAGLDLVVLLRHEPGKSGNEFPERLDVQNLVLEDDENQTGLQQKCLKIKWT